MQRFTTLFQFDFECDAHDFLNPKTAKPRCTGHTPWLLTSDVYCITEALASPIEAMKDYLTNEAPESIESVESVKGLRGIEGARKRAAIGRKKKAVVVHQNEPDERQDEPALFIAQLPVDRFRNDLLSLEHPLFALSLGDTQVRSYKHGNIEIIITPPATGAAYVKDKDLWIYCVSHLVQAIELERPFGRWVQFTMYDFLKTTKRNFGKLSYAGASLMLSRLSGTRVKINTLLDGRMHTEEFGLIETFRMIEDADCATVAVLMPHWLYQSVQEKNVLSVDPEYFDLSSPLERRIYEIARKHCGGQGTWKVNTELLQKKCGSQSSKKEFARALRKIEESQPLPRYKVRIESEGSMLRFTQKNELRRLVDKSKKARNPPTE